MTDHDRRPFYERHAVDEGWQLDTLSVHAGQEPDEATGAVAPPIYQTSTYAQDARRGHPGRLRVRPDPEPDPRAPRAGGRDPRGRRVRRRLLVGIGSDRGHRRARRAGRGDRRRRRPVRRDVPLLRQGPPAAGGRDPVRRPVRARCDSSRRARRPAGGRPLAEHPARLVRDPDEPATEAHRHRRRREGGPRPSRRRRPGAARRRRQHVRLAGHPAADPPRCRHRLPLGHEVPRRPFRHRQRGRGHEPAGGRRAPALPPERDGRGARTVRLLPRPPRPADARPAGRSARRERRRDRPIPRRARRRRVGPLPRSRRRAARPPAGRPRRPPDAQRGRDGLVRTATPAGRRGSSRPDRPRACRRDLRVAPGCSPLPSRSAASSRSSRSHRR